MTAPAPGPVSVGGSLPPLFMGPGQQRLGGDTGSTPQHIRGDKGKHTVKPELGPMPHQMAQLPRAWIWAPIRQPGGTHSQGHSNASTHTLLIASRAGMEQLVGGGKKEEAVFKCSCSQSCGRSASQGTHTSTLQQGTRTSVGVPQTCFGAAGRVRGDSVQRYLTCLATLRASQ